MYIIVYILYIYYIQAYIYIHIYIYVSPRKHSLDMEDPEAFRRTMESPGHSSRAGGRWHRLGGGTANDVSTNWGGPYHILW
jgi:hypothetical protein